jgi:hypothetical protein
MKKILAAALLLTILLPVSAHAGSSYWKALSTDGESGSRYFLALPFGSAEDATDSAREKCHLYDGSACEEIVAAPIDEYLMAAYCTNGYDSLYRIARLVDDPHSLSIQMAMVFVDNGWVDPADCTMALLSPPMQPGPGWEGEK